MATMKYCGWARPRGGPWQLAGQAETILGAEELASRFAMKRGFRVYDVVALKEGEIPVRRRAAAPNLITTAERSR